jgi:hypothetical protein
MTKIRCPTVESDNIDQYKKLYADIRRNLAAVKTNIRQGRWSSDSAVISQHVCRAFHSCHAFHLCHTFHADGVHTFILGSRKINIYVSSRKRIKLKSSFRHQYRKTDWLEGCPCVMNSCNNLLIICNSKGKFMIYDWVKEILIRITSFQLEAGHFSATCLSNGYLVFTPREPYPNNPVLCWTFNKSIFDFEMKASFEVSWHIFQADAYMGNMAFFGENNDNEGNQFLGIYDLESSTLIRQYLLPKFKLVREILLSASQRKAICSLVDSNSFEGHEMQIIDIESGTVMPLHFSTGRSLDYGFGLRHSIFCDWKEFILVGTQTNILVWDLNGNDLPPIMIDRCDRCGFLDVVGLYFNGVQIVFCSAGEGDEALSISIAEEEEADEGNEEAEEEADEAENCFAWKLQLLDLIEQ